MADALQTALKMDEKPIIGNITFVGNTTSGVGGEQEMVAMQIDANVQESKRVTAGEDDGNAALEVYNN